MLTEPMFKGKLVVVLAGYEDDMDKLMGLNQGLRSRFSRKIRFTTFNEQDCCDIMLQALARYFNPFLFVLISRVYVGLKQERIRIE